MQDLIKLDLSGVPWLTVREDEVLSFDSLLLDHEISNYMAFKKLGEEVSMSRRLDLL